MCLFLEESYVHRNDVSLCLRIVSQPMRLLVIFGIALLVFGPKKLPELGKGIGGIHGFKQPCTR